MPKKYQKENTKAVEARNRKASKAAEEKVKLETAKEDEYWRDDDKHINKKNQRKDEKEQKRLAEVTRKKENRMLEEEEKSQISSSLSTPAPTKVTVFQLQSMRGKSKTEEVTKPLSHLDIPLEENLNRNIGEDVSATGVENALKALSEEDGTPRISMAAAFKAFKDETLPKLKQKNPKLKFSQLNDLVKKEWQRSPSNPINRR